MSGDPGPRARMLLAAIEREIAARASGLSTVDVASAPLAPLRADATLLTALELAVAGRTRSQVARELHLADDATVLEGVFGTAEQLVRPRREPVS